MTTAREAEEPFDRERRSLRCSGNTPWLDGCLPARWKVVGIRKVELWLGHESTVTVRPRYGHGRRDPGAGDRHRHGQWTEIEARGVLEAWRKSGQSLERYARSRGLVPQRLHWWKKKLRFSAVTDKGRALGLLSVQVVEPRADARRGEPVTVLLRSGHMLKVGRDFDEQTFARVVALLERA